MGMTVLAFALWTALIIGTVTNIGIALSILWGWFLVPIGLPAVSISHAVGISAIASLMTASGKTYKNLELDSWQTMTNAFLFPWWCVLIGYGAKAFMP